MLSAGIVGSNAFDHVRYVLVHTFILVNTGTFWSILVHFNVSYADQYWYSSCRLVYNST